MDALFPRSSKVCKVCFVPAREDWSKAALLRVNLSPSGGSFLDSQRRQSDTKSSIPLAMFNTVTETQPRSPADVTYGFAAVAEMSIDRLAGLKSPPAQRSARRAFRFSTKVKRSKQKDKKQLVDLVDAEGFLLRRVCLQRRRKVTPETPRFSGLKLRIGKDLEARPGNGHCHVNTSC